MSFRLASAPGSRQAKDMLSGHADCRSRNGHRAHGSCLAPALPWLHPRSAAQIDRALLFPDTDELLLNEGVEVVRDRLRRERFSDLSKPRGASNARHAGAKKPMSTNRSTSRKKTAKSAWSWDTPLQQKDFDILSCVSEHTLTDPSEFVESVSFQVPHGSASQFYPLSPPQEQDSKGWVQIIDEADTYEPPISASSLFTRACRGKSMKTSSRERCKQRKHSHAMENKRKHTFVPRISSRPIPDFKTEHAREAITNEWIRREVKRPNTVCDEFILSLETRRHRSVCSKHHHKHEPSIGC